MKIIDTPLSVRAKNALRKEGFQTLDQCISLTEQQLVSIRNLGKKTTREIIKYFEGYELKNSLSNETNDMFNDEYKESFQYLMHVLSIPLSDILLSVRTKKVFENLNLKFLKDLVLLDSIAILSVRNSGQKTLREMKFIALFIKKVH